MMLGRGYISSACSRHSFYIRFPVFMSSLLIGESDESGLSTLFSMDHQQLLLEGEQLLCVISASPASHHTGALVRYRYRVSNVAILLFTQTHNSVQKRDKRATPYK